ncbi:unnamed protein product [Auanema sp. JU1783]|nr:unnamed protein product [Auanema sp. JU1783]
MSGISKASVTCVNHNEGGKRYWKIFFTCVRAAVVRLKVVDFDFLQEKQMPDRKEHTLRRSLDDVIRRLMWCGKRSYLTGMTILGVTWSLLGIS